MIHIKGEKSTSELTNVKKDDVQPNAVDLRVAKIFKIKPAVFELDENKKVHRGSVEVDMDYNANKEQYEWYLEEGHYEVVFDNIITVGPDEAGWVITRSTLIRNGLFLKSGLYDSGYSGMMAGCLHVSTGTAVIGQGTRLGQYLNFKSEALHSYDGDYGSNKEHDNKYK